MRRCIWVLPCWCHELILRFTGWRLVKVIDTDYGITSFLWTDSYPMDIEGMKVTIKRFRM